MAHLTKIFLGSLTIGMLGVVGFCGHQAEAYVAAPSIPTLAASATEVNSEETFYIKWSMDATVTNSSLSVVVGSTAQGTMTYLAQTSTYPYHFNVTQRTPVTFQITASNAGGTVQSLPLVVYVDPEINSSFMAAPTVTVSSATVASGGSYSLSWNAISFAQQYDVNMETAPDIQYFTGSGSTIAQTTMTTTGQVSAQDRTYYYRVRARNAAGVGAWSDAMAVLVKAQPGIVLPTITAFSATPLEVKSGITFYVDWAFSANATSSLMTFAVGTSSNGGQMTYLTTTGHYPFHYTVTQRTPVTFQLSVSNLAGVVKSQPVVVYIDP